MDRINGADFVDIGGGRRGFRSEDLPSGTPGTEVTDVWLNMVQEEIIKVIEDAGLALDPGDWTQLLQAIKRMGFAGNARARRWLAVNSMTLSSAPGAPTEGDAYLVPVGATGIWAGNVGKLAEWSGTAWTYTTPPDGHGIALPDGRLFVRVGGSYVEKVALDVQSGKWSYAVAAGTADALTAVLTPTPPSYAALVGAPVRIKTGALANTGAVTLDLNGLGAKAVKTLAGAALAAGRLLPQSIVTVIYDGVDFRLQGDALPALVGTGVLQSSGGVLSWISAGAVVKPAAIIIDQKAAGATGGALVSSTWAVRALNADLLPPTGLYSLVANEFTVNAACLCRFSAPVYAVGRYRHRIYNVTDSIAVALSTSGYTGNTSSVDTQTSSGGICELAAGKTYRLETWVQSGGPNAGGLGNLDGSANVFSQVELHRL